MLRKLATFNTCSVGIATQDPLCLRAKFSGKPEL